MLVKRDWGRVPKKPNNNGDYCCSKCKQWKTPSAFNKNKNQKSGLNYACRSCMTPLTRSYNLPVKYGITNTDYLEMLTRQESKCACCGRCNLAAGNVGDSSAFAKKLVDYLQKWKC